MWSCDITTDRSERQRRLLAWGFSLLWLALAVPGPAPVAGEEQEYDVKARYVLGFAQYVEWPPEAFADHEAPLIIGVLGNAPAAEALERELAAQGNPGIKVNGRKVEVRRLQQAAEADRCHLLFVTWDQRHQGRLLQELEGKPVLTVGDSVTFLRDGGTVQLIIVGQKLRFDVDLEAARRAGLAIPAPMLECAREVLDPPSIPRPSQPPAGSE